jgi:hypothetical protein
MISSKLKHMAFVDLSHLKRDPTASRTFSTASRTTVSSGFCVNDPTKLPRLNDRSSCVACSGFTVTGRPCKNSTLNRSGFCQAHETPELKSAAFLLMCDEALEALDLEEIPEKILPRSLFDEPIRRTERRAETDKDPIPDEPIVKEISTATPVNQVHNHYNLSGLMKQINIFIVLCLFAMYMYKSMDAAAPRAAPPPPSAMLAGRHATECRVTTFGK